MTMETNYKPVQIEFFEPFKTAFDMVITDIMENKPLRLKRIMLEMARVTGKTWTVLHAVVFIVEICKFHGLSVDISFIRNSRELVMNTMAEFCNYMQELNANFVTDECFIKNRQHIEYQNMKANGYIINPRTNPRPTLGLTNSRADLIIVIMDERSELDGQLLTQLLLSIRSDKPGHQRLEISMSNPDGADSDWCNYVFNELNLPLSRDELIKEEGDKFYKMRIKGDTFFAHGQCWCNPFLSQHQKQEFRFIEATNTRLANVVVYGIPAPLSGQVYDNLDMMIDIKKEEWDCLLLGVDVGYTDTDNNGGSTCVQCGLFSLSVGIKMIEGWSHNNKYNPLPTASVYQKVYDHVKTYYFKYKHHIKIKQLVIYVDDTGAATWLESKRVNDNDIEAVNFTFKTTKDINKSGWTNQQRAADVNTWIALGVFSVDKDKNKPLFDDLKKCVWIANKSMKEGEADKFTRWHKYTDSLNAMEYASWNQRANMNQLVKLKTNLLERFK